MTSQVIALTEGGFGQTEGDQNERGCHEHPARMKAARPPEVSESAKQVKAPNE